MKLVDVISPQAMLPELEGTKKDDVIKELVDVLVAAKKIAATDAPKILKLLMSRERLGTTGIGKGVAFPHAKIEEVDKVVAAIGVCRGGVDWAAIDGEPVQVVLLFLSPIAAPSEHLAVMSLVSSLVRTTHFVVFARQAKTRKALVDLVKDAEDLLAHPKTS